MHSYLANLVFKVTGRLVREGVSAEARFDVALGQMENLVGEWM